jgi:hypothetical protein
MFLNLNNIIRNVSSIAQVLSFDCEWIGTKQDLVGIQWIHYSIEWGLMNYTHILYW